MTYVDEYQPLNMRKHPSPQTVWEDEQEKIVHFQISLKYIFQEIVHPQNKFSKKKSHNLRYSQNTFLNKLS